MLQDLGLNPEPAEITHSYFPLLITSAILLLAIFIFHMLIRKYIQKNVMATDLRRRWMVQSRNGLILFLLLGLVIIWGNEIRTFALSVVAIAAAFVIATKELILCISGTILKTGARSFNIGDRIQIKDFRGDVIDQNFLATTILEVGPGKITHQRTGRMTVIPNSMFVSEPLINESFTDDYVLHVFTVPFKREDNWRAAQQAFLEAANKHCAGYLDEVRGHMKRISSHRGLEVPTVEPRVTVQVPTAGEIHLIIRIPTKSGERGFLEQSILTEVLSKHDFSAKKE